MILGMSTATFTLVHVVISLVAIASGFLVAFGMMGGFNLPRLTALFLATTALTSVTGFFFPFRGMTPGIVVGIVSLIVLAIAVAARYGSHLAGGWRTAWVVTAVLALYLNFFVLIVQMFEKVPALRALAPTQKELPFKVAQLCALALFVAVTWLAIRGFRVRGLQPA